MKGPVLRNTTRPSGLERWTLYEQPRQLLVYLHAQWGRAHHFKHKCALKTQ